MQSITIILKLSYFLVWSEIYLSEQEPKMAKVMIDKSIDGGVEGTNNNSSIDDVTPDQEMAVKR